MNADGDMSRVWISTVRIVYPAFHLWSGYVDHTVWETTGRIRDRGKKITAFRSVRR